MLPNDLIIIAMEQYLSFSVSPSVVCLISVIMYSKLHFNPWLWFHAAKPDPVKDYFPQELKLELLICTDWNSLAFIPLESAFTEVF